MDPHETADLERRVQAHETLLTALLAAVGKEHPAILTRLEGEFAPREGAPDGGDDAVSHIRQMLRIARKLVGAG